MSSHREVVSKAAAITAPLAVWMWWMHGWPWGLAMAVGGLAVGGLVALGLRV